MGQGPRESEYNPFDISDKEIKENEEAIQEVIKYGSFAHNTMVMLRTDMYNHIEELTNSKDELDKRSILETVQEWHDAIDGVLRGL